MPLVAARSRHKGPQDTEVVPAAAARGHENGRGAVRPAYSRAHKRSAATCRAQKPGLAWIKPAAQPNHPQPRPASTLVAANFLFEGGAARLRAAPFFTPG